MTEVLNSTSGCSLGALLGRGHSPGPQGELAIQLLMLLREITALQVRRRIEFLFFAIAKRERQAKGSGAGVRTGAPCQGHHHLPELRSWILGSVTRGALPCSDNI